MLVIWERRESALELFGGELLPNLFGSGLKLEDEGGDRCVSDSREPNKPWIPEPNSRGLIGIPNRDRKLGLPPSDSGEERTISDDFAWVSFEALLGLEDIVLDTGDFVSLYAPSSCFMDAFKLRKPEADRDSEVELSDCISNASFSGDADVGCESELERLDFWRGSDDFELPVLAWRTLLKEGLSGSTCVGLLEISGDLAVAGEFQETEANEGKLREPESPDPESSV